MLELERFDLRKESEMTLFNDMFSAYLKEVCDEEEYQEEMNDLHDEALNRQMIEQTLQKHNPYFVMKIVCDNNCVGFISYFYREERRLGFINNFYLLPNHRHSGIGSAVCALAEKHLATLGACVIQLNPVKNSQGFYVRNGFTLSHVNHDGETIFQKQIDN